MNQLKQIQSDWEDTPQHHELIHEQFILNVNFIPDLKAHRDYVEQNVWGFGERSFWWLWKIILCELPKQPALLEIGVFRAATLSLWKMLRPDAFIFGVTPLDASGGVWESDFASDIAKIHDDFKLPHPHILKGRSDAPDVIAKAINILYDVVYVDGDHSFDGALFDLKTYAPMVKKGGYLVIDDACNDMKMPWGYFQGIDTVTAATVDYLKENSNDWEFITNVVHLRVLKRV